MSRRLLLVSLDWRRPKDPRQSLGHASILARLAVEPGLDVVPIVRAVNDGDFDPDELLEALVDAATDGAAIAIGVYVWNEQVVQCLLPQLRRAGFTGQLILGGPQVTYAPPGVLRLYPDADVAIRGAGEEALVAVLRGSAVAGAVVQTGPDLGVQAKVDLGSLPSPLLSHILPVGAFMRWETQRGCIFACNFCQHREPDGRRRPGVLGAGRLSGETRALVSGGAQDIAVLDPIFHSNPAADDILRGFARAGYRGRLSLQSRFELVDDAFLDACAGLDVRLEFGLQTVHLAEMRAVQRINDLAAADRVIAKLHAREIHFEVSLIYGLPDQTLATFEASVGWCLDRGVPVVRAFPLMLLRGTGLERDRGRWGLVENDDPIPVVVRSNTFDGGDWKRMREIAAALEVAA